MNTTLHPRLNPSPAAHVGNAKWLGASLSSLIRAAGPLRGAEQLFCTSVDGFTSGVPLATVLDAGRELLVAVAMNGAALPTEHGFPARLVVPGLYGYVSACKWVVDIEVIDLGRGRPYWYQNGWAQQAPIKTEFQDRRARRRLMKTGKVPVAGVGRGRSTRASRRSRSGWTTDPGTRRRWPPCPISTPGAGGSGSGTRPTSGRTRSRRARPTRPATRRRRCRRRRPPTAPPATRSRRSTCRRSLARTPGRPRSG